MKKHAWLLVIVASILAASSVLGQEVSFKDPTGDDNGPGTYTYPTDRVYRPGSFDLTSFDFKVKGDKAEISVGVNAMLEDKCWSMQFGFCVQMVFVFVKTDPATGFTQSLPGLDLEFAPSDAWNKVIIMSPQPAARVRNEVETKVPRDLQAAVIVPDRVKGGGRTIMTTVPMKDLGTGDPTTWGWQVLMQSNEGFPDANALLTRRVNEYEGQHRFGGGNDGNCDPEVMDIIAGNGTGDKSEIDEQHKMLAYECNSDGTPKKVAQLKMVYLKK